MTKSKRLPWLVGLAGSLAIVATKPAGAAPTAISGISTINTTGTTSSYTAPGAVGSNFSSTTNYTLNFNTGTQDLNLTGIQVAGSNYPLQQTANFIGIRRSDNPLVTGLRQIVLFQTANGSATNPVNLVPTAVTSMEQSLLSTIINRGADNVFANTGDGSGNNNNIERIDFITTGGITAPSLEFLGYTGFVVLDRGGNDTFKIAAITAVDAFNNPTAFGPLVSVGTSAWGRVGSAINTLVARRDGGPGNLNPSAVTTNQQIAGVFISYSDLGISAGQNFYGYALFGTDVVVGTHNLLDPSTFPKNTSSAGNGGLDLLAGGSSFMGTPPVDLAINKTDNLTNIAPGSPITYAITVTNNGSTTLSSIKVTDTLPATIQNPVYRSSTGTYNSATGMWTGLTLATGQSITLTISGTVSSTATGTLSNTATVAPLNGVLDTNASNNSSTDTTTITPAVDLSISKTDGQGATVPGAAIAYTITVTNNGPTAVNSVTVTDSVPSTIQNPVFTANTGTYNSSTGAWTGLNLATGQSITLTLTGTVSATATGTITNTATVAPPTGVSDPTPGNNTATDPTNVYSVSPVAGRVVINEVLYRQSGTGAAGNDEFIELYNASSSSVDLSNWKLADGNLIANSIDAGSGGFSYTFPSNTVLAPGQYAVIWIGANSSDRQASGAAFQTWLSFDARLNNDGDDVWLYDSQSQIVDYIAYGVGSAINTPPPPSLNLWDATSQPSLAGAATGQSISLTANGQDGNTSACWEATTSGQANGRCTGALPTRDTEAGSRVTSVGANNNGAVATPPSLLLVKRITAINGVNLTGLIDDPNSTSDNAANWPTPPETVGGISAYLRGVIDGGMVRPGDIVEYTIYFLSNGGAPATNVRLCDLVPANSTFMSNSFGSAPASGISLAIGTSVNNLTNVPDADAGEYFIPGAVPAVSCSTTNANGAVVIRGAQTPIILPNATTAGTANSYGYIRFRARVN